MGDILLVDDNLATLSVLDELLRRRGYDTRCATNGALALALAREQLPDLLLLDAEMPQMDGCEVCRALRDDARTRDVPVIFVSIHADLNARLQAFEAGAVDFIVSPYDLAEVAARVGVHVRLARERAALRAGLETSRQERDTLLYTVVHELKSPLATLTGYLDLLTRIPAVVNETNAAVYLAALQRGAERMGRLVMDVLELARLDSARQSVQHVRVSLLTVMQESVAGLRFQADAKRLLLEFVPPPDDLLVPGDEMLLVRALSNLLSNAIKYTPVDGHVLFYAERSGDHAVLHVADNGMGIAEDDLPQIFERFFRTREARMQGIEGTGLGLPIVKTIVEQHGGSIAVSSTPGAGTEFVVTLPCARAG